VNVVGLFAGIGGLELGLSRSGGRTLLLCEWDAPAQAVLRARFPEVPVVGDVRELAELPRDTELVTAGFPCQDLSQAGQTKGIGGERSGLVAEVFRLLERTAVPNVLLENVPFMLQLAGGSAMRLVTDELGRLGYRWAYRVLDSRAFGLPQRRQRVFIFASRAIDPLAVLFPGDAGDRCPVERTDQACGFYWTEGERGLGWAVDAVPTLKGGSTVGIPSPPAIWFPDGRIETPDIRDMERLQGFAADWTKPTEGVARATLRFKQVGNAVSVPVAEWVGRQIAAPQGCRCPVGPRVRRDAGRWPYAAALVDGEIREMTASPFPVAVERPPLASFLEHPTKPLSLKATAGFLGRLAKGNLRLAPGFREAIEAHLRRIGGEVPAAATRPAADRPRRGRAKAGSGVTAPLFEAE
jgi:DNA (cytosine-5)-methyltransferase 1